MEDSIFTKIIKGEIPCQKVYEDDKVLAILDIHPVQTGMTVIFTKVQVDNFEDLDDGYYDALWRAVKKVALKMRKVFPEKRKIGVQVEGLDVPHVHVKVFPIDTGENFRQKPDFTKEADPETLAALAVKMREA